MIDAYIPEGALAEAAEKELIAKLTEIVMVAEGADPTSPVARSISWVFLHRPAVFVGGAPADAPRYKIVASVPEGQFDDERRASLVPAVTNAVLDAENGAYPRDPGRVWVFASEVPEGTWGGHGRIARLADIATTLLGDADKGRAYAEERLGARRTTIGA